MPWALEQSSTVTRSVRDQITAIKADLNEYISGQVVGVALSIRNELVSNPPVGTPIDTSWASNNWWMGVGTPPTGNDGQPDPAKLADRSVKSATSIQEALNFDMRAPKPIFITNNVPYINALDSGSSKQSPSGFVETAVARVIRRFETAPMSFAEYQAQVQEASK